MFITEGLIVRLWLWLPEAPQNRGKRQLQINQMNSRKYSSKLRPAVRSMSAVPRLLSSVLTESNEYRMSRSIPWLLLAECAYFFFLSFKAFNGNSILLVVLTLLASLQIHPTVCT